VRQEGENAPPESTETNHHTASEPSIAALELVEPGHLALSRPSTVAPELMEIGRPALSEPSVAPPDLAGGGHFDSSKPFELREGSKWQHADEEKPGSSKLALKHPHMMASG